MIRDVYPGSGIFLFPIPDPDTGVKKHWIPGINKQMYTYYRTKN